MGYSENIKNTPLHVNNNYTDGCGMDITEKYYYNGAYIDLCGLPIKEYMKNPFCCNSESGDTPEYGKTVNKIRLHQTNDGTHFWYQAESQYDVTNEIKITISFEDKSFTVLEITNGTRYSTRETGSENIIDFQITPNEDDNFIYEITEQTDMIYDIYFKSLPLKDVENIDFNILDSIQTTTNSTNEIKFIIPKYEGDYSNLETEEMFKLWEDIQNCFVLYIPKELYVDKRYVIKNYESYITEQFLFNSYATINGKEFVLLVQKSSEDNLGSFVPLMDENITYNYNLILK
jgi:hypothetical protein